VLFYSISKGRECIFIFEGDQKYNKIFLRRMIYACLPGKALFAVDS
jgi:hypothetical protein